ncbi:MAG: cyclic pyranopterin monophosphate synthase MoaC [Deltaproteobacteria bacterium]|nr:cyclic pyranopterin monophosphate synthase MoaC [Deltaproteobacteria bacterium]MBW2415090.1 cyclic pyranopterin monophosphate synthase MoaC [Deltaproteobacteria bacterium]
MSGPRSSHFDESGRARMVDVGDKDVTSREAVAEGRVRMSADALRAVVEGSAKKGDVLGVARLAGIQAAKRTSDWIPLAHPLPLDAIELDLRPADGCVEIEASVRVRARTGVEMEALVAVSAAALTVYDMLKSIDRAMQIDEIRLLRKSGGKSGVYSRTVT